MSARVPGGIPCDPQERKEGKHMEDLEITVRDGVYREQYVVRWNEAEGAIKYHVWIKSDGTPEKTMHVNRRCGTHADGSPRYQHSTRDLHAVRNAEYLEAVKSMNTPEGRAQADAEHARQQAEEARKNAEEARKSDLARLASICNQYGLKAVPALVRDDSNPDRVRYTTADGVAVGTGLRALDHWSWRSATAVSPLEGVTCCTLAKLDAVATADAAMHRAVE